MWQQCSHLAIMQQPCKALCVEIGKRERTVQEATPARLGKNGKKCRTKVRPDKASTNPTAGLGRWSSWREGKKKDKRSCVFAVFCCVLLDVCSFETFETLAVPGVRRLNLTFLSCVCHHFCAFYHRRVDMFPLIWQEKYSTQLQLLIKIR